MEKCSSRWVGKVIKCEKAIAEGTQKVRRSIRKQEIKEKDHYYEIGHHLLHRFGISGARN